MIYIFNVEFFSTVLKNHIRQVKRLRTLAIVISIFFLFFFPVTDVQ